MAVSKNPGWKRSPRIVPPEQVRSVNFPDDSKVEEASKLFTAGHNPRNRVLRRKISAETTGGMEMDGRNRWECLRRVRRREAAWCSTLKQRISAQRTAEYTMILGFQKGFIESSRIDRHWVPPVAHRVNVVPHLEIGEGPPNLWPMKRDHQYSSNGLCLTKLFQNHFYYNFLK